MVVITLILLEFGEFPMMARVLGGTKVRSGRMNTAAGGAELSGAR